MKIGEVLVGDGASLVLIGGLNVIETESRTIEAAKSVSEPLGGEGESEVLRSITVNFGQIEGGLSPNLVASRAVVRCDVRLPMGVDVMSVEREIRRLLDPLEGVQVVVHRRYEPTWTSPADDVVGATLRAAGAVLGTGPVANMRVGASDARLYRAAGVPTVVCGLTPHNLGGPDEYADIDEMVALAKIHAIAALDYLSATPAG